MAIKKVSKSEERLNGIIELLSEYDKIRVKIFLKLYKHVTLKITHGSNGQYYITVSNEEFDLIIDATWNHKK
jgi:hypothetical protein